MTNTDEAKRLFEEKLLPAIRPALELRDAESLKLARLEEARLEALSDVDRLESELASAEIAAGERVSLGAPIKEAFKHVGKIRDELADQRAWLNQLDQTLIPGAKTAFRAARQDALTAAREALPALRDEWGRTMQPLADGFIAAVRAWQEAARDAFKESNLPLEPLGADLLPKVDVEPRDRALAKHFFA